MPRAAHLHVVQQPGPIAVSGKVTHPPRRKHLTPDEVGRLMTAAGKVGRHGQRDATLILLTYRHGLREGEVVTLRWDALDLKAGSVYVARLKNGTPSTHPLRGPELRALRRLRREYPVSPYVFTTERHGPMTCSNVRKMVARAGQEAKLGFPVHPHMLRHATGYTLANAGHDTRAIQAYLGHRSIASTVIYTSLAPTRFKDFWRD